MKQYALSTPIFTIQMSFANETGTVLNDGNGKWCKMLSILRISWMDIDNIPKRTKCAARRCHQANKIHFINAKINGFTIAQTTSPINTINDITRSSITDKLIDCVDWNMFNANYIGVWNR